MILNFIAYANPKLDIPMLREVLSVPERPDRNAALDSHSIMREGSITKLCRSLIRKSNDGCHYEFAHFSVQEFLEGEMQTIPELEQFRVSNSICQLLLARQCLKYLLLQNFSSLPAMDHELPGQIESRRTQNPFYSYAAVCWPVFAKDHWADEGLVKDAGVLFRPRKSANFISWALELTTFVACYNGRRSPSATFKYPPFDELEVYIQHARRLFPQLVDRKFTTFHMAAALSLPVICSSLVDNVDSIDARSGFGSPLQCAVQGLCLAYPNWEYMKDATFLNYHYHYYWQVKTNCPEFGRENTIRLLLGLGADHTTACSSPFSDRTLVTVSLDVGYWMMNLSAIAVLLDAGCEVKEDDLSKISWERSGFKHGPDDTYGLRDLITCLRSIIDRSPTHFGLCQAAWSLAIEMGCRFTQDPAIVDTRISHSEDALAKTIFTSVREADIKILAEALKDPRANIASLTNEYEETIFDEWVWSLEGGDTQSMVTMLQMLLSAGMEVNRPSNDGLLPLHRFATEIPESYGDDDEDFAKLCDIVSNFMRKGKGCSEQSRANRNIFHFGLRSIWLIKAVLERETEDSILTALRTRDDEGHTPITLALEAGRDDVAMLLLETGHFDPESLRGPASVHALCVAGGAHRAFNSFLEAGIGKDSTGLEEASLLHHVGPKTSKDFVIQLVQLLPNGLRSRIDGKLPLDTYLEKCIKCKSPAIDADVLELLLAPGSEELNQGEKKLVWEHFTLMIQGITRSGATNDYPQRQIEEGQKQVAAKSVRALLRLGFVQSYEEVTRVAGVLPFLKPLQDDLDDLWPISSEDIHDVLKQTVFLEPLRESGPMLRLLKAAVRSCDLGLVELLLESGISVHERIDEMSALEVACLRPANTPVAKDVFLLLLDHADTSRWDEINPHQNQRKGLIHYLAGRDKTWQLEELIKRGADINLPTSIHVSEQPAVVQHLWEESAGSAMTLLDMGADPTAADGCGIDVAMQAAFHGHMDVLQYLYASQGKAWQLNWQRSCAGIFTGVKSLKLFVSGMNALHLTAWSGQCDALGFYVDNSLLTDLDSVSVELLTPMHLAAFNGHVRAMTCLYSRGAGLNLKSADGSLPLHLAVRNGHADAVRFLVENGSSMCSDSRGLSPVRYAIQLQDQAIVDCLCTTRQSSDDQSTPAQLRERDLARLYEQALIRGDIKECELLHDQGCPVNADLVGQSGRSALVVAIEHSHQDLIKWLLAHDAKASEKKLNEDGSIASPLGAMIVRPALNHVLHILLQKYQNEGGSAAAEKPSLICIAIQHSNNVGLGLLLQHIGAYDNKDL